MRLQQRKIKPQKLLKRQFCSRTGKTLKKYTLFIPRNRENRKLLNTIADMWGRAGLLTETDTVLTEKKYILLLSLIPGRWKRPVHSCSITRILILS